METSPAVRARGITKRYADVVALDGIDLDIAPGRVHGLVGPNGAGKTTLLGLLLGLSVADCGILEVFGNPVARGLVVPDGIAGFVDGPGLYPHLTARQNLLSQATLLRYGAARRREVDRVLEEVGLTDVADDRLRGFSLGMRQRLGLAAALLTRPRLLVLDEPANGLDPAGRHKVHGVVGRLADEGTAVVVSSHRMDDLAVLCDEVTLLATGRIVFSGPISKLATEIVDLDYRVVTSDRRRAAEVAAAIPGLRVVPQPNRLAPGGAVVVRGSAAGLDELVVQLIGAGVAIRELAPVVAPLEAAFLALTGADAGEGR